MNLKKIMAYVLFLIFNFTALNLLNASDILAISLAQLEELKGNKSYSIENYIRIDDKKYVIKFYTSPNDLPSISRHSIELPRLLKNRDLSNCIDKIKSAASLINGENKLIFIKQTSKCYFTDEVFECYKLTQNPSENFYFIKLDLQIDDMMN